MKPFRRRSFLQGGAAGAALIGIGAGATSCSPPPPTAFNHGVASGDPTDSAFIIWTRVSVAEPGDMPVQWVVSRDPELRDVVASGKAVARPLHDYCVKVDVALPAGETPGSSYHYGFVTHDQRSPIGRTRTFPSSGLADAKLAVVSCSNYMAGFFHVYRELAKRDDIQAVLHLGDYIYEYGADGYGAEIGEKIGRLVADPGHEILSLRDYRGRYAQYRSDPDLQAAHARHPFIAVWDDHESANNSWREGAQNHDEETEGSWSERRAAALQVYSEWMPIRLPQPDSLLRIYRDFRIGDLVHLHMLDTRLIGRDRQLEYSDFMGDAGFDQTGFRKALSDPDRQLLGPKQYAWLEDNVAQSEATWQVLGQQVLMGRIGIPKLSDLTGEGVPETFLRFLKSIEGRQLPSNLDAWDGYPVQREALLSLAQQQGKSLISLAGDTHNAWASNLYNNRRQQAGVEFAVSSVTSPGISDYLRLRRPKLAERRSRDFNPGLRYINSRSRGYLVLSLSQDSAEAEYIFLDSVLDRESYQVLEKDTQRLAVDAAPGSALRS
ncbi:MAG: alkaline phosphatase D family protein [Gammaproteobacteria bacterium AqS3]|nr:alkaline phosphatase D family protein [Gammaproteobacteria bacterium AqS3]